MINILEIKTKIETRYFGHFVLKRDNFNSFQTLSYIFVESKYTNSVNVVVSEF